jgi:hypothetical protein
MPAIPRDRFLDAMSRVAATVNVVTTDGPGGRAGVTVSAMTPVSADGAAPTLLICLHEDSRTTPAIAANRCFCINVLREDQASLMPVVVVESPAKAKTINKYLGPITPCWPPTAMCATCRPRTARSTPSTGFDMTWEVAPTARNTSRPSPTR